jgi:hypothetical protein
MGKYADKINQQNKNLSAQQVRDNKNQRCKERNLQRKEKKRAEAEERQRVFNDYWKDKTLQNRLDYLNSSEFNASREKRRLEKLIAKSKENKE